MVTDSQTDAVFFSAWLTGLECWKDIRAALEQFHVPYGLLSDTRDYWVRDFMPVQLSPDVYLQYVYIPDYLRDSAVYRTDGAVCFEKLKLSDVRVTKTDVVLDGGNVIKCGDSVIMTDKTFYENRNYDKVALMNELERCFGAELVVIPWDHHERYGHADGMVRYLGDGRVLLTNYGDFDPGFAEKLLKVLSRRYEVTELCYPVGKPSPYNWAYINYLQVGEVILLPRLDMKEDGMAYERFRALFPQASIGQVGVKSLVRRGGALNCVSWNICNQLN